MQRNIQEFVSASEVVAFWGCKRRTNLDLGRLAGWTGKPAPADTALALVQGYGGQHARSHFEALNDQGQQVVVTDKNIRLKEQVAAICQAPRAGAEVIFQGTSFVARLVGYGDFLFDVNAPPNLGQHRYEITGGKLTRSMRSDQHRALNEGRTEEGHALQARASEIEHSGQEGAPSPSHAWPIGACAGAVLRTDKETRCSFTHRSHRVLVDGVTPTFAKVTEMSVFISRRRPI